MAEVNQIKDINHTFGNDIISSGTGDLATVTTAERGKQRVLRRLLTRNGGYIWHPEYGAGLPAFIGQSLSSDRFEEIKGLIFSQIFLEDAVSKTPEPEILLQTIQGGLYCQINYIDNPTRQAVVLTFNVSP